MTDVENKEHIPQITHEMMEGPPPPPPPPPREKTLLQKYFGCIFGSGKQRVRRAFDDSIHVRLKKDHKEHPEEDHFVPRLNNMQTMYDMNRSD